MRIRFDRSEMVEKLGVIAGIVPSNTPKPILFDFFLETRDGSLDVEASDLEVSGRIRVERVEVIEPGKLALPAGKIISILREIPAGASGVSFDEVPEMRGVDIRAEGFEFKLFGNDPEEFPRMGDVQAGKELSVDRGVFLTSLKRVSIAASRDPTRYQLNGVFFEIKGGKMTLTATDGKRLTNDYFKLEDSSNVEVNAIVPNRAVDAILKILSSPGGDGDEKFTLGFTDTDVVVRSGHGHLNAKLVEGAYPSYRNALPQDCPIKVKANRADLLAAAKGAQLMTDSNTSTVVFLFDKDGLRIYSQAKDVGETKIQIKAEVEKGPLEIRFNPTYFIDALRCIEDDVVSLEFQSDDRPGVVRGGQHYRHMIMPLVFEKR
jgi:DNA polymerase-3 subunit beta